MVMPAGVVTHGLGSYLKKKNGETNEKKLLNVSNASKGGTWKCCNAHL